jgi:hypothetical protein
MASDLEAEAKESTLRSVGAAGDPGRERLVSAVTTERK